MDYILKYMDESLGKPQIILHKNNEIIAGMISIIPKFKENVDLEDNDVSCE